MDYKTKHTADSATKFHCDWPKELGDLVVRKKNISSKKHLPLYTSVRAI